MRTMTQSLLILLLVLPATFVAAESPSEEGTKSPISEHSRFRFDVTSKILLRTAELMPEEKYGFRPSDDVRTFAQILGHVADSQYWFCSSALEKKNPAQGVEKTKSSKAELIAALKDAFAYCASGYDGLTDVSGGETVEIFGGDAPKLSVLDIDQTHTIEHYGNLVVYLRLNGIVPPTSDQKFMSQFQ